MASTASNEQNQPKQPGADTKENTYDEKEEKKPIETPLDVAFVLDCTGSMNSYIQSCKENIISISTRLSKEVENCDVQFALVLYRDIPPQDTTFVTKLLNFTPIPFQIQIELDKISASGGGDSPECLTSALYDCHKGLKWREESIKIIVVITDAPPHGLEKNVKDGFPDGDIDTFNVSDEKEGDNDSGAKKMLNVIDIIQAIRNELKAVIYSVACEPDLSCNNDFANDFMQYIAEYTKGRFLPLSSAKLLPDVIVGSVKQQINLKSAKDKLMDTIAEIKAEHGNDISSSKLNELIAEKWKAAGVTKKEITIGKLYRKDRSRENINLLMNEQKTKSLKDFKANCQLLPRIKLSDFRHLNKNRNKKKVSKKKKYASDSSESDWSEEEENENENENKEEEEEALSEAGGALFGDDDDEDNESSSCASQQVYSESDEWLACDIDDLMD